MTSSPPRVPGMGRTRTPADLEHAPARAAGVPIFQESARATNQPSPARGESKGKVGVIEGLSPSALREFQRDIRADIAMGDWLEVGE